MGFNVSTNMNLPVPQVGNEPGPQYATDVNNCLTLVDQHDHTPGYGVQVPPGGLNINSDLTIQDNNLTNIRSARFFDQGAVLTNPADLDCIYVTGVDLYYNDGNGNNIRMTQSGGVAGTPGSISNLVPPASVAYVPSTQTFIFQSDVTTAANLDIASVILRNLTPGSFGLTLNPPPSMIADYQIALPTLPLSNLPVSISATGDMTAAQITSAQLAPSAQASLVPSGAILPYGGTSAPAGFLMCDGASNLRSTYPALFSAIGTAYGAADGTHFNVPDLRGTFIRGVDNGAGRDPDTSSRTAMNTGGNTGDNVGSVQPDDYESHKHGVSSNPGLVTAGSGGSDTLQGGANHTITSGETQFMGGNETRPVNAYVNFIIKT